MWCGAFLCVVGPSVAYALRCVFVRRVDYIEHPLGARYVHQGEKYRAPEGEFDPLTSYNKEYTSRALFLFEMLPCSVLTVTEPTMHPAKRTEARGMSFGSLMKPTLNPLLL